MKVVDLSCGCRGLSEGFKKGSFNIVAAINNWVKAIATYEKNHWLKPMLGQKEGRIF